MTALAGTGEGRRRARLSRRHLLRRDTGGWATLSHRSRPRSKTSLPAKTEAWDNGCDEAILLTQEGYVSEGSGENIFMVSDGKLITPSPAAGILVGITRNTLIELAQKEFGIQTVEREIPRSELYSADECFMTGTAAHVTPVIEIDRRAVGTGKPGPITRQLMDLYASIIRGNSDDYHEWCTPVSPAPVAV